jgi:aspartate 1-decarboxylase
MLISVLKSKIHRATITGSELDYEGSIAIDKNLLKAASICPHEQVHVLNVNTGGRLVTYAIESPAGSGEICLNGPAARLGQAGDIVIIVSYCLIQPSESESHHPVIVKVDKKNQAL